jgi:hypothetical protein
VVRTPDVFHKSFDTQIRILIAEPFASVIDLASSLPLVVIDGLDECDSDVAQRRVLHKHLERSSSIRIPLLFGLQAAWSPIFTVHPTAYLSDKAVIKSFSISHFGW